MLKLYNTLTRKKEIFRPLKKNYVKIYTCGPTVYDFAHLGNFRAYLAADLLKRYLQYKGFQVKQVMNITDVDDKTIRNSRKEKIPLKKFTEKYIQAFFEDLKVLNIRPADFFPRATDHIKEMVFLIKQLLQKGFAYQSEDGSIYYNISKFKEYGKLAKINIKQKKNKSRLKQDDYKKEKADDFALWKAWDKKDGDVYWETEWGKGRPGWHIECSAMSMKYLGRHFDIHTGGIDLIFPHHENEIAQSEAATGKKFVNYWFHNEWLLVAGKKMSKRLGNFYTLRDILKKGCSPLSLRYFLLATHYRQPLNFTFQALEGAKNSLEKIQETFFDLKETNHFGKKRIDLKKYQNQFEKALDDDLNISPALAAIFELIKEINKNKNQLTAQSLQEILSFFRKIDSVLGLLKEKREEIPPEVLVLVKEREKARQIKNWALADRLREEIREKGYLLEDRPEGTRIKRKEIIKEEQSTK